MGGLGPLPGPLPGPEKSGGKEGPTAGRSRANLGVEAQLSQFLCEIRVKQRSGAFL